MVLKNITRLMQQQQSRRVMRPFSARIDFAAERRSEGASTIGGGLGKFHREALRDAPADYQASLKVPKRQGSEVAQVVPSKVYATIDGFIMIAVGNDKLFALFARVLGHLEWTEDPRFRTNPDRVHHRAELSALVDDAIGKFRTADLQRALDAAGVPNAPVQSIDQALEHGQTRALGIMQRTASSR